MNKSWIGVFQLWLFYAACLLISAPALADEPLKKGSDGGNDAALANMYSVRQDYHKRFPHAKMAEQLRAGGRIEDNTKEVRGSHYEMSANNLVLDIPAGPLIMKQTGEPKSPDPYNDKRPQYRPLYAYCGSPGFFIPGWQPGMMGNFVPNYSKVASGQGGAVMLKVPMAPTCYVQPPGLTFNNTPNLAQEGDQSIFEYELTTFGVGPISDTQFQMIDREDNQRFLELLFDPERWTWAGKAAGIMQQQQMSTNMANTADWETSTAYDTVNENLINVANEDAGTQCKGSPAHKSKNQAIWMVQQMYKQVFLPMAILFLLPGAVMTQMKGMVQFGILNNDKGADSQSPFSGIVRSIVAIFLIPATQLIVSYMIDVGNSMTHEVKRWVSFPTILSYAHKQEYGPQRDMTYNCLVEHGNNSQKQSSTDLAEEGDTGGDSGSSAGSGGGGDDGSGDLGKAYGGAENKAVEEKMPQLSKQIQLLYNVFNCCASIGLVVLADFQLVMMCYLFLLGPLAGAFFAWPELGGSGKLFNKVFSNWLEGVFTLSLWRFWWMVVLACLTTYIGFEKEMGWFNVDSEWEMMVFTSFQVLLLVVPFQPFDFKKQIEDSIKQLESKVSKEGGGGGGGGGGDSGGKAKG